MTAPARIAPQPLTDDELTAALKRDRIPNTPGNRRYFRDTVLTIERAFHHMPALKPVGLPIPYELAADIVARPWTDAPTAEEARVAEMRGVA